MAPCQETKIDEGCGTVSALPGGAFPDSFPDSMQNPRFDAQDAALFQLAQQLKASGYAFTTVTPATHKRVNARPENAQARSARDVFGWSRPFQPGVLAPDVEKLARQAGILGGGKAAQRATVRLSSLDGELFWHSAYPTQAADAVFFGPDTYRFGLAIDTYLARDARNITRAVDLCCGAGPGAILVAKRCPRAEVLAIDINEAALRLCRINAALAQTPRVEALNSNLLGDVAGDFDLIVANPPYLVDQAERAYRHGGGPLGAGLSLLIVDAALERLSVGGTLLLYTGVAMLNGTDPFRAAVSEKLAAHDVQWNYREIDPDVFGEEISPGVYEQCDRIAAIVLEVTKTAS